MAWNGTYRIPELLLFLVLAFLYFLPSYFARKKRNRAAIFALNFLLGWTVAGRIGSASTT
jgi:hypothetical protein